MASEVFVNFNCEYLNSFERSFCLFHFFVKHKKRVKVYLLTQGSLFAESLSPVNVFLQT